MPLRSLIRLVPLRLLVVGGIQLPATLTLVVQIESNGRPDVILLNSCSSNAYPNVIMNKSRPRRHLQQSGMAGTTCLRSLNTPPIARCNSMAARQGVPSKSREHSTTGANGDDGDEYLLLFASIQVTERIRRSMAATVCSAVFHFLPFERSCGCRWRHGHNSCSCMHLLDDSITLDGNSKHWRRWISPSRTLRN